MGNVILWLNQNPAVSISILVLLVLVALWMLWDTQRSFTEKNTRDYNRKRIYRNTSRGSTVKLSRPLGEDEGYGK